MRKLKILVLTFFAISIVGAATFAQQQKVLSVLVQEGHLRSAPSPLSKIIGTVPYTGQVEVLEKKGAWYKVKTLEKGIDGWMHSSALTKKTVTLKAGEKDVAEIASSSEVALAGKMFNAAVEQEFKASNRDLNYAAVDKMEQRSVSQTRIVEFLEQGELSPEGGAK